MSTQWLTVEEFNVEAGRLTSVALTDSDDMICAGETFIAAYKSNFSLIWEIPMEETIWALDVFGDTVFAASREKIYLFSLSGELLDEWGPYDDEAIITGISANRDFVAFADAGNLLVYVVIKMVL